MTPDARTRAGLRVALVVSMYTAVEAATGWGEPSAVNKDPRKKTSSATPLASVVAITHESEPRSA